MMGVIKGVKRGRYVTQAEKIFNLNKDVIYSLYCRKFSCLTIHYKCVCAGINIGEKSIRKYLKQNNLWKIK